MQGFFLAKSPYILTHQNRKITVYVHGQKKKTIMKKILLTKNPKIKKSQNKKSG